MLKRCVVGSLFVVAVGCGKNDETSSKPPPPPPVVATPRPPVDAGTIPPRFPDPPDYVVPAFGGTVPTLPQLSRDGASAAVDLSFRPVRNFKMRSFEVGFLSDRGKLERVVVLDSDTAAKLVADPGTTVDPVTTEKSASTITKRLADGAFSEFATAVGPAELRSWEARRKGEELAVSIDKAKLVASVVVNEPRPTSLKLRLDDAAGKKVREQFMPGIAGDSSNDDCAAAPILGGVWFDTPRKRMLIQIVYVTVACDLPAAYHLWKLP